MRCILASGVQISGDDGYIANDSSIIQYTYLEMDETF